MEMGQIPCLFEDKVKTKRLGFKNHRMAEVRRDLWRSSGPTLLLKQGHLELVAQDYIQMAFEYLQQWRLRNLSGQPMTVLCHPHSKNVFSDVQREPPVFQFQFVPIASGPVRGWLPLLCTFPSGTYTH